MSALADRPEAPGGDAPGVPLLSILLVNYNGKAHLQECLESVFGQGFRDFEVVLVDNASKDDSVAYVEKSFPEVSIVRSPVNSGFAGGNNLGLPLCRGRWVFLLNNDTRLEAGALQALADDIARFPGNRVFACFMLRYAEPGKVDSAGDNLYTMGAVSSFAGFPASLFTRPREVTSACAGAAVYARSVLESLGGFDEDFFLLMEDVDLSLRARHLGESILFLPGVRVLHKGSASIGGAIGPIGIFYGSRNYPFVFVKNFPLVTLLKCAPGICLMLAIRFLQSIRQGYLPILLKSWASGLAMLPAMLAKRKMILSGSKLSRRQFEAALHRGWFRQRLAFKSGRFIPPP